MPEEIKDNFASSGTESFNLAGELTAASSGVTLSIDEESEGVLLDNIAAGSTMNPNFFLRWYAKINAYMVSKSGVKVKEKANFYHLLSVMINAGIPMVKALRSLVAQMSKSPRMATVVSTLATNIEDGGSLSGAMNQFSDIFSESEVGMIQSGEASGQLSKVLESLASDTEKSYMIRAKVKSAMIYPVVIFFLLIAVIVAMMVYVVPKLTELFATMGGELPLITRLVVATSNFLIANGIWLVLGLFAFTMLFSFLKKTSEGRYLFDKLKLKIPIFGGLLQKSYLSRFARSLSNLLDSNVSIVKTLEITANSIGNEVYKRRLLMSVEDIKQGIPLAENLSESNLFPPMLVNMIDVGEKTAQLGEITQKVALFYEDEVDTAVSGISKIIEPVVLIVVGLSVGTIVAAIMLPIMELANLSGSL